MKRIGLDIGSTTVKYVVLDEKDQILASAYERHGSHVIEKSIAMLSEVQKKFSDQQFQLTISGSAGMGLAQRCSLPFVQEVYAVRVAVQRLFPQTDCVIELGGEDAKILFLSGGMEVRMNGSCAGGTGAFMDQMATLLHLTPAQMNDAALQAKRTYTIASRCGVFAKSDIQPLINQGADTGDIAASIYQAIVSQTIAGLAQGRTMQGNILYLGGPLTFSEALRSCFDRTLKTVGKCPENSLYYVALGAAWYGNQTVSLPDIIQILQHTDAASSHASLPPLFADEAEYQAFRQRHARSQVPTASFDQNTGPVHIGIDAGSTTVKVAVIDSQGRLLATHYQPNLGNPVPIVQKILTDLYEAHPDLRVASATATGYGEMLIRNAFHCDFGVVETVAHYTAAKQFLPQVDFIIDIGGQDMKCLKIAHGAISDIFLNEACSSGCGSFLQTFAAALGYSVQEFAALGLQGRHPVDLGSRCTVFMNSSVKQAQKDGVTVADISAGLSISVVKNALYKVIRCASPAELGKNVVVQGGTFYNEAVLRAFEKEMGISVIRPDICGLMGAYGSALYGRSRSHQAMASRLLDLPQLRAFTYHTSAVQCQGCGNHCQLTINTFSGGQRLISGNCCDRPLTGKAADESLNLYAYKQKLLQQFQPLPGKRGTIGIPMCLNMFELLPFWHTFFTALGFTVQTSPFSTRELYQQGQATIPSDTVCFPAKLAHGHIHWLLTHQIKTIFYPCMPYNFDEGMGDNHYNCPVVAYYPEVLADNCSELKDAVFIKEIVDPGNPQHFRRMMPKLMRQYFPGIQQREIMPAYEKAMAAYQTYRTKVTVKAQEMIALARAEHRHIIVLAGRPYHADPEVNHGIDKLILHLNAAVISEDAISPLVERFPTYVLNQWTYHSRLYAAARYCAQHHDMDLVQLVSFGCGVDAITADETREILESAGKLYTQLKIDEITNLGAVSIRLRSLLAALEEKEMAEGKKDNGL